MEIIVTQQELDQHKVEKYFFRKVGSKDVSDDDFEISKPKGFELKKFDFSKDTQNEATEQTQETQDLKQNTDLSDPTNQNEDLSEEFNQDLSLDPSQDPSQAIATNQNEELLKKIDELSSSVIKLEMAAEKKEQEFQDAIEQEKNLAFEQGFLQGEEANIKATKDKLDDYQDKLFSSIKKLENAQNEYENSVKKLEEELVLVSLDIAKEVIKSEVSTSSAQIARNLAKNLLENVKEASSIKLKVSKKDEEILKDNFDKNISLEVDDAISPGGIVILSNIGNINAQIKTRFEKLKKESLENFKAQND